MNNVVDLFEFREHIRVRQPPIIFYLNNAGTWLGQLNALGNFQVEDIRSELQLHTRSMIHVPKVVLIESDLHWMEPLDAIRNSGQLNHAPMVVINQFNCPNVSSDFLKRAFAAGAYDTLPTPLHFEELRDVVGLLSKYQKKVSG